MKGNKWQDVTFKGKTYPLGHLHPFNFQTTIEGTAVKISVAFSNHCFTDKKGEGKTLMSGRYFCEDRYNCSLQLPTILEQHLASGYVIPHFDRGNNEVYYYAAIHGYAVFFDLRPHVQNAGELTLFVTSAYEVDQWGKATLPKGKAVKFTFVGHKRLNKETLLPARTQKRH